MTLKCNVSTTDDVFAVVNGLTASSAESSPWFIDGDVVGVTVTPSTTEIAGNTLQLRPKDTPELFGLSANLAVEAFFGSTRLKTCSEPLGTGNISDIDGDGASQMYSAYTIVTDAIGVSWRMGRGAQCNVIIDGKYVSKENYVLPNIESTEYLNVQFATRKVREITLQVQAGSIAVSGVRIEPLDTIYAPKPKTMKIAAVSDSFGEGASDRDAGISWPIMLGQSLSADVLLSARASTGFLATSTSYNYLERVSDVIEYAPDMVFASSTVNDSSLDQPAVQANVQAWYNAVRSALPKATIVVFGSAGSFTTTKQTNEQNVRDVIDGIVDNNLYFIPVMTDDNPPITGTGNDTSPVGDGNADRYITDDAHYNLEGQIYYANWLLTKFLSL